MAGIRWSLFSLYFLPLAGFCMDGYTRFNLGLKTPR
jgi:hypothetical protein